MSRLEALLHIHLSRKRKLNSLDRLALLASFLAPMTAIPQIFKVYSPAPGVSIWAWLGLMPFSLIFMIYGRIHKIKPMIVTNILWLVAETLICIGILTH